MCGKTTLFQYFKRPSVSDACVFRVAGRIADDFRRHVSVSRQTYIALHTCTRCDALDRPNRGAKSPNLLSTLARRNAVGKVTTHTKTTKKCQEMQAFETFIGLKYMSLHGRPRQLLRRVRAFFLVRMGLSQELFFVGILLVVVVMMRFAI